MKRTYITEKSVREYIKGRLRALNISEKHLLYEVIKGLTELNKYSEENKAQIRFFKRVVESLNYNINKARLINATPNGEVEYHRKPTNSEIKFGEGATHYKTFNADICFNRSGNLKKWLVCPIDGLRYYR